MIPIIYCLTVIPSHSTPMYKMLALILSVIALCVSAIIYNRTARPLHKLDLILRDDILDKKALDLLELEKYPFITQTFPNLYKLFDNMKTLALRESNAQLMKTQAELDALQSQINPHFLYNTLDTIRGQARMAGLTEIEVMTLSLSKLFQYSISDYNEFVTLKEELGIIDNYLLIQNLRFDNRFRFSKHIESDTFLMKVPKMLLQPLVENSVRHGLEPKLGQGTLLIDAYRTRSRLFINISDDGVGIPTDRLTEINHILSNSDQIILSKRNGFSIGLYNVNTRIRLLFGFEYGLSIVSAKDIGTKVQISLPILT